NLFHSNTSSLPALIPIFFVNVPAADDIYTLSLHDALPISSENRALRAQAISSWKCVAACDLKSTEWVDDEPPCLVGPHFPSRFGRSPDLLLRSDDSRPAGS